MKRDSKQIRIPEFMQSGNLALANDILEQDSNRVIRIVRMSPKKDPVEQEPISDVVRTKLVQTSNAFSVSEAEAMLDGMPIELIFNRLAKEIEKNQRFAAAITDAMNILKQGE